ncbi:MAG: hypothetical protein AVDCRST_MAG73-3797, partial [uncultured Thermomicrobiales bacterium]
ERLSGRDLLVFRGSSVHRRRAGSAVLLGARRKPRGGVAGRADCPRSLPCHGTRTRNPSPNTNPASRSRVRV